MSKSSLRKPPKLPPGSPHDPVRFGHYYLLGLIARGGMAEVYRARLVDPPKDGSEPRLFAIKVMRPELAKEARFVDMFHREGQLALMLKDSAIVETVELGNIDGRHFISMEYIGGRDLTQILRRCQKSSLRIPVPHVVHVGVGIAKGLDFAHNLVGPDGRRLSLVNRDVSPSNVRVAYTGDVKLLDFGIAQALMKFTSEIGILKGKFSYMSPEQIRGMPVDQRTDIFSAGIIIHEMLTTEKLFRGDTEFALMERVRKADVVPPSKFNRRVSPELDRIVMKALARDVSERYSNSAEMHADLKAVLEGYRFDIRELRDFMRKEFKREYNKDLHDSETARVSVPAGERLPSFEGHSEAATAVTQNSGRLPGMPAPAATGPSPVEGSQLDVGGLVDDGMQIEILAHSDSSGDMQEQAAGEPKSGFWSRMFKKKK
ncbi:MAG: serine/threonine protein kinase [Myxococcales bacterium]|nr:serine/threonine protein kinase [Myxococcales bacterium]